MTKPIPQPRKSSYMGMPINHSHGAAGTWMEGEGMCYPSGGMLRRCRALCPDGRLRVVRCGIADTVWTVPVRGGGYVDSPPESDAVDAKHVFHYHPPQRVSHAALAKALWTVGHPAVATVTQALAAVGFTFDHCPSGSVFASSTAHGGITVAATPGWDGTPPAMLPVQVTYGDDGLPECHDVSMILSGNVATDAGTYAALLVVECSKALETASGK